MRATTAAAGSCASRTWTRRASCPAAPIGILRTLEGFGLHWDGDVVYQSHASSAIRCRARPAPNCAVSLSNAAARGASWRRSEDAATRARAATGPPLRGRHRDALPRPPRSWLVSTIAYKGAVRSDLARELGDIVIRAARRHLRLPTRRGGRRCCARHHRRGARRRPAAQHGVADCAAAGTALPTPATPTCRSWWSRTAKNSRNPDTRCLLSRAHRQPQPDNRATDAQPRPPPELSRHAGAAARNGRSATGTCSRSHGLRGRHLTRPVTLCTQNSWVAMRHDGLR